MALGAGAGVVAGLASAAFLQSLSWATRNREHHPAVGRMRYDALLPALAASITGDLVVRALGVRHAVYPRTIVLAVTPLVLVKVALAGLCFGLASAVFVALTLAIKDLATARVRWAPARPVIGGLGVIGLTFAVGSHVYLGLSLPLIEAAMAGGAGVPPSPSAAKLVFTAVTLGSGFQGGEVTPLFVTGATLGATLAHPRHLPVAAMAAIGFLAVFAGAANTPLACVVMGVELFGAGLVVPLAVACVVAYTCSSHRGIYGPQRIDAAKDGRPFGPGTTLDVIRRHRRRQVRR